MIITDQFKIAVSLIEESISLVDDQLVVNFNGNVYALDADASDILEIWQDIKSYMPTPTAVQDQLTRMVLNDQEYGGYFADKLEEIKYNIARKQAAGRRRRPTVHGNIPGADDWFNEYVANFEKLESDSRLRGLPHQIAPIFKDDAYAIMDNPEQDFVAILPTPTSMASFGGEGAVAIKNKGVYVLRKIAHQSFPDYRIRQEDQFTIYVPKIAETLETTDLLYIREVLVETQLGIFYRRDHRLKTVTEWIPSDLFTKFDDLLAMSAEIVESIAILTTEEPVATLYCRRAVFE